MDGTAATLNSGDRLIGGAGIDTLVLTGQGDFHIDQLATFTGFESIGSTCTKHSALYLGSQSIAVTANGAGASLVWLGSGAVTFQGNPGYDAVASTSASNWNASNSIDGGNVSLNMDGSDNAVYDLTTNTLSHIGTLYAATVQI